MNRSSPTYIPLIDRDVSWLQFNDRVLNEARTGENPLLDRAKFIAISSSNLDEFFMIRFASLNRAMTVARSHEPEKLKPLQKIRETILREVGRIRGKQSKLLLEVAREMRTHGIQLYLRGEKNPAMLEAGRRLFRDKVLPHLEEPETFGISKLRSLGSLQICVISQSGKWWRIPKHLPALYSVVSQNGEMRAFFLDDLLALFLCDAFGISGAPALLRLTRDGDVTFDLEEEDPESLPEIVRTEIHLREHGRPVRLQYSGNVSRELLDSCCKSLKLEPDQTLQAPQTLCLPALWSLAGQVPQKLKENPQLALAPVKPIIPRALRKPRDLFGLLKTQDILLHHPYDSFDSFVSFVQSACEDPHVQSISMTLYRTDTGSPIIEKLKSAAKKKKIRVVIELRARFDELNNARLAETLRKAGVEVAFGWGRLKLHAKIALVERMEDGQKRSYTHLSTGNYNAATARQYTDLAILTAHPEIGDDAEQFFESVMRKKIPLIFKKLVSAPGRLHRRILSHIEAEIKAAQEGKPARIFAKLNALVDDRVIESLYRASAAGVKVDLVVRGACALVPGVPGVSENIRVISIIDRFLEHSRIYYFENSETMYFSSADWMPRNFFSRLEIAYPVLDPRIYRYMKETAIPAYLQDSAKARELASNGTWRPRTPEERMKPLRSQFYFQGLAQNDYEGTALATEKK